MGMRAFPFANFTFEELPGDGPDDPGYPATECALD